jgi:hypothetical protein
VRADLKQGTADDEQADGKSYVTCHGSKLLKLDFGSILFVSYTKNLAAVDKADLLPLVLNHPHPDIMPDPV